MNTGSARSRRPAYLACGYGIALGIYLGLVVGFRINPDFLDHSRELFYSGLILLFAIALHANRRLTALSSWTAYILCCAFHVLAALTFERLAIFKIPQCELRTHSLLMLGFFVLAGLLAQVIAFAVRKYLLPPEEKTERWMKALMPWLPLVVLLAMTLHTVEHVSAYGDIRNQRHQYGEEKDYLHGVVMSLAAQSRTTQVQDGAVIATLALHKEIFSAEDRLEAILVFENNGQDLVMIQSPHSFAAFFSVRDNTGVDIPFESPPEWELYCGVRAAIQLPPGQHRGMLVPLNPWFALKKGTTYSVCINWKGKKSDAIKFAIH
jgi:hypothetical protein